METTIETSQQGRGRRTASADFTVISSDDETAWSAVLADVATYDVHHLAGYHRLAEARGEGRAHLFAYRSGDHVIALPLLLRPIDESDPGGLQDATSVYGYAGPVASDHRLPSSVCQGFAMRLLEELQRRRVVAVFSRLHPLIEQEHPIADIGEIRHCGPTVSVDLAISPEEQWAGYRKDLRRLIRRGREAGITCIHDQEFSYLPEWAAIYAETMERVGARDFYRFDQGYFERMVEELGSVVQLFIALVEGRPAAGGLYTICHGIVEAHLGGLRQDYAALPVVRMVDDTARRWASEAGARVFHLGGGLGGEEDSLFRYKAMFSARRHSFKVWQWVIDEGAYEHLCRERMAKIDRPGETTVDRDHFPVYRAPLVPRLQQPPGHRAAALT